jgi:hypothetical protein
MKVSTMMMGLPTPVLGSEIFLSVGEKSGRTGQVISLSMKSWIIFSTKKLGGP